MNIKGHTANYSDSVQISMRLKVSLPTIAIAVQMNMRLKVTLPTIVIAVQMNMRLKATRPDLKFHAGSKMGP